jgi:DNA-binding NtrC family response regulator
VSAALAAHPWPGNIREFQNVVERMLLSAQGPVLGQEHIPEEILRTPEAPAPQAPTPAAGPVRLRDLLEEEEREATLAAVRECRGNLTRAALRLGISRNTLYRKMDRFGL